MVVRRMTRLLKLLVVCWAVGRSVGSGPVSDCCWADEWMDAVLPNSPQPILSPIYYCLVCFSVAWQKRMRKKRKAKQEKKKRFFFILKKVDPRDLFPVPFGFISISLWYLVQMRFLHTDICPGDTHTLCKRTYLFWCVKSGRRIPKFMCIIWIHCDSF